MIKAFPTLILLFLLIPFHVSFGQTPNDWASKVYSGYLHQDKKKAKEDLSQVQCSIEFKSPIPFTHQVVNQLPQELSYFIKFKNSFRFKDFAIVIYSNDGQDFTIDPEAEGKQVGINDEHHIYDTYLIYLILGENINHLEIVSTSQQDKDRYILDKVQVKNDD